MVTLKETRRHLEERSRAREREAAARAVRLRSHLAEAAQCLAAHGARRVLLFGSLANGRVHPGSDVDLAVEGLPATNYFEAMAELMRLFGGPVDLVRLEEAAESLRERIATEGQAL